MRKRFLLTMFSLVLFAFCGTSLHAQNAVAKVGDMEYATIDEAIANWTNGTTLTLLADVTLSDVIKLNSNEYHILDLGTYTMTAAKNKDAIQYVVKGRTNLGNALDIKADATKPGGITATGKAIVSHTKPLSGAPSKDRPITRFYGGVFNASNIVKQGGSLGAGYTGASAPSFQFYGGEFNGNISTNRSLNQFYGGVFNGSLYMSVDSSAYTLIAGGRFKGENLPNGNDIIRSTLTNEKFHIGSAKGSEYNRSIYVDAEGYYVVTSDVITEVSAKYPAVTHDFKKGTNNYLYYSAARTYGLFYEDAAMAIAKHGEANVTIWEKPAVTIPEDVTGDAAVVEEIRNNTALNGYTPENLPENAELEIELKSVGETFVYDVTPMANGAKVEPTEAITFRLPVPASVTEAYAKVSHDGENMGIYEIKGEGNAKYVEISSADFSEFAVEPYEVATYDQLLTALKNDSYVMLTDDITGTATESSGYGKAGIVLDAGKVLDGNGKTLTINGADATWDCAIAMRGGEVKNLTIAGAMRGVFMPGANGDVVIDNCVFEGVIYTFNSDAGSKEYTVTIKNTVLNGWTSFSNAHEAVVFESCKFGEGSGYAFCRPYQATTFTGCEFNEGYEFDTKSTTEVLAFNDCTYDEQPLSADNNAMFYNGGSVKINGTTTDVNHYVATIGTQKYLTLDEAFAAATEGQTITLLADATPALKSQRAITKAAVIDLDGKTLTLTEDDLYFGTTTFQNGTIVVDPSVKPSTAVFWMFANQTLTFDKVKVVATGVTGTYLIGLDGNNSDLNLINGSEILVENTTALDLDIICVNASTGNDIIVDNSKVNVTNLDGRVFFRGNYTVSGNSEVNLEGITKAGFRIEAGQTLSIEDTSKVNIVGEPRDGGIHLTDLTATYTKAETATVNATVNEVKAIATINGTKYASLQAAINAVKNGEEIILSDDCAETVTFTQTKEVSFVLNGNHKEYTGSINITARAGKDAPSTLVIKNFNFKTNAISHDFIKSVETNYYPNNITISGCTFSGTTDINTTDYAVVAVRLKSANNIKIENCTGTGLHSFLQNTAGWNVQIDNVDVTNSLSGFAMGTVQGANIQNCDLVVNKSGIRFDAQLNNNAVITDNEIKAFIPVVVRKASVESSLTFNGENTFTATNTDGLWCAIGTSEYGENGTMPTDATGKVKVTLNDTGLNAAGVYGDYVPVAKIGETEYTSLEAAFKAATSGCVINIINNVTVDYAWDCRNYGATGKYGQFSVPVTINGNGNTIKFTAEIKDNNWNTVFRFEDNATVKNLTVDIANATGAQRVISAKKSLNVDGLTIVGTAKYGIIFGEGASATDLAATEIVVMNSTLNGTRRAVSDNEGGKDVKSVVIEGNTFNANVYVSASESIAFNNNTVNGETDLRSYAADNVLNVQAQDNTLATDKKNYIYAKTIDAQEEFETKNPPLKVSNKAELDAALTAAKEGNTITLTANIDYGTDQLAITKNINLNLGGNTLTTRNPYGGMSVKNNPTIKNGTIVHASNTAAIKVWNATAFEDLVIDVQGKGDANKTIGGIVLQSGSTTRVGLIKNVTIKGAALTNGIETYNCGDATENVIGAMENVTIDAVGTGMLISAPCGTATNCDIKGGVTGIELWIKGNYSATLALVDSDVKGGEKPVYVHDEFSTNPDIQNNGTLALTANEATTFTSESGALAAVNIARAENADRTVVDKLIENAIVCVGDVYFDDFAKAWAAVKDGQTVTLLADIEPTSVILIDKSLTINGNGHKVTSSATRVFRVTTGNTEVTLEDVNMVSTAVRVGTNDVRGISIDIVDNVKLTLNNSSVDFTDASANDWAYAVNVTGGKDHVVTVIGGTYEGANVINVRGANNTVTVKDAILTSTYPISDQYYGACIWVQQNQGSSVEATGNTFNGSNTMVFNVGTGTTVTESNNTDNTTMCVAKIGNEYYTSLAAAFAVGGEVKVLQNIVLAETATVPAGKVVTLNLNGKTISQSKACTASYEMINNKGNLTITGNGKLSFTDTSAGDPSFGWGSYTVRNEGTLVVENGTIEHKGAQAFATHMICAIFQYSGSTTIKGGTISTPNYRSARLWKGDMTINGGKFEGQLWVQAVDNTANLVINGGEFAPRGNDGSSVFVTNSTYDVQLAVTGGKFATKIGCSDPNKLAGVINGGSFTQAAIDGTNSALIALGYEFGEEDAEGYCVLADNPATHYIATLDDLKEFRDEVNSGANYYYAGVTVYLAADIDLNNEEWEPIGTFNYSFDGNFDGQGHVIKNLKITDNTAANGEAYLAFFGVTANNTIKNFVIENVTIESAGQIVAAAIAYPYYTTVSDITVRGDIAIKGGNYTAGVLAYTRLCQNASKLTVAGNAGSYITGAVTVGGVIADIQTNKNLVVNYSDFNVSGVAISGAKSVGAISGIISGQALDGATVKNVTLNSQDGFAGIVAGRLGIASTISNVVIENVTGATAVVGATYDDAKPVQAKIGDTYYATLENALAANGEATVELLAPVTIPAGETVVFDLNKKTVVATDNATGSYAMITNKGDLTIEGEGALKLTATNNRGWNAYSSVISNTVGGKLTVNGGTIEHLGGTDMAYGIDNLTNGKGTYAETVVNGGTVKSTYRAIRQFLNGVEAQNILTVNDGIIEGANKSIWMQDPSKNANTGTLTVAKDAELKGDVYLFVTAGSTEWPVEVSIANEAFVEGYTVLTGNVPETYVVEDVNGTWGIFDAVAKSYNENEELVANYSNFESAIAAAAANVNITRIEVISDYEQKSIVNTENYYDIKANLVIAAAEGKNYTVKGCDFAVRVQGEGTTLTIADNLTIEGLDVVANGFATSGENMIINGTVKALSLKQWTSNGTITVNGKVELGYGDGQFDMAYGNGNGNVVVNGNGDKTVAQFKAGYSGIRGNGGTLTLNDTYFEAGAWFKVESSNNTIDVNNSLLKVSGGDHNGALTLATSNVIKLDINSQIVSSSISGAGTITIDAADFVIGSEDVYVVKANMSGFTGTINVANNNYVIAEITETGVVIKEKELEGEGTADNPYELETLTELELFRNKVNAGDNHKGKYVKLSADVNLSATRSANNWEPIGTTANPFKGTFDGDGYTISNLVVEGENCVGLFGYADNATIKNVTINNANVKGADCVGVIAGNVFSTSLIDNCHVKGNIKVEGQTSVGGIVGKYYTKVSNCSVIGDGVATSYVKGTYVASDFEGDNIGGIMGHCGENNNLTGNTVKNITISGTRKVGGIVGIADQNTDVKDCVVENVNIETTATVDYANTKLNTMSIGALIGQYQAATSNNDGTVANCVVKNVKFVNENNVTVSAGPITGGARGGSNGMLAPEKGVTSSNNDIYMSTITGSNNEYLMNAVAKIGDVKYYALQDAFNAGGEVVVLSHIALTEGVTVAAGKVVTLDLAGYTISQTKEQTAGYQMILNDGTLTIEDSSDAKSGKISYTDSGNGGEYISDVIYNRATLVINGGTIENLSSATVATNGYPHAVDTYSGIRNTSVTINGGTICCAEYSAVRMFCVSATYTADLTINDGTVRGAIDMQNGTKNAAQGSLTINGGNFETTKNANNIRFANWNGGATEYGIVASVTGGNFNGGITTQYVPAAANFNAKFITGGTFTVNPQAFCAAGYTAKDNYDGTYTVKQVAGTLTRTLPEGWSWFSSYVDLYEGVEGDGLAVLENALGTAGVQIKDNAGQAYVNYSNGRWRGSLATVSSETMYAIKTSAEHTLEITGEFYDINEYEVSLRNGWNYLSYPHYEAMPVVNALGFTPANGDAIKGKGVSAFYVNNSWIGAFSLTPGEGYMYYSNEAGKEFSYSTEETRSSVKSYVSESSEYWTVDASQYPSNMTMIATLDVEGADYEVAAFVDGEVRGSARPIYVDFLDQYIVVMTINGENVANVTFKYYDLNAGEEYDFNNVVVYSNNAILGSIESPYALTRGTTGIDENSLNDINIYPNPTTTDREINLQATCDKVEVFNTLGVKVAEYQNVDSIDALETAGTYVIRVTLNGDVKHCRLVVK